MNHRSAQRTLTVAISIALLMGAVVTAFPFIWMLLASLKPQREALDFPPTLLPLTRLRPGG